MEVPAIRYAHTEEGVSLAYAVFGDGPPLFYAFAGPALSNFEHEWNHPGLVEQYEAIAQERTVVQFDWRNCGLSTRHVDDVTPAAHVRDLLALQDHLGFAKVALRVHSSGSSIAFRYAATHPDRVSSLILSSPSVIVASPDRSPSVGGRLLSIGAETDWRLFSRLLAVSLSGWDGPDTEWFTALIESADRNEFFRTASAMSADDVSDLLADVQCPVLIVQRREPPNYFFDELDPEQHLADSRLLTRDLRESRLVILEGATMMITSDPASTAAVLEFLRDVDSPRHDADGPVDDLHWPATDTSRGTVTVLGSVGFVAADGRRVELTSTGQRRLLAALAIARDTVRAESLSEMLGVGGSGLRTALSRLRARIGDDTITTDASGYRIEANIDATRFEQLIATTSIGAERLTDLEAALALWNGGALDEFSHEQWAEVEAARLDELALVAAEDRSELLIGLGRSGEAVSALEAFVTANPHRDRPRGLLLQALACEGRQADALRAYHRYRSLLADQTGTEPSPNVRAIEQRLASGDGDERVEVIERLRSAGLWNDDADPGVNPGAGVCR